MENGSGCSARVSGGEIEKVVWNLCKRKGVFWRRGK